jgi:hypothetical protein
MMRPVQAPLAITIREDRNGFLWVGGANAWRQRRRNIALAHNLVKHTVYFDPNVDTAIREVQAIFTRAKVPDASYSLAVNFMLGIHILEAVNRKERWMRNTRETLFAHILKPATSPISQKTLEEYASLIQQRGEPYARLGYKQTLEAKADVSPQTKP